MTKGPKAELWPGLCPCWPVLGGWRGCRQVGVALLGTKGWNGAWASPLRSRYRQSAVIGMLSPSYDLTRALTQRPLGSWGVHRLVGVPAGVALGLVAGLRPHIPNL